MSGYLHVTETRLGPDLTTVTVACRCGWTGTGPDRALARAEGDRHLEEANR